MTSARVVYAVALADFRERSRRYSFLTTLLFVIYLGYAAATGKVSLRLGDYRGLYTSAWVGAMMSLITTTFLSLVGFYIVKNAVENDRQTGVGEILASTPLSRILYLLGKFTGNFTVLASMVGVTALAALATQFLIAEDRVIHLWALLSPFLLISLPAMALTASLAVLFETVQWFRGGFGNVAWFFLWALSIRGAIGPLQCDPFGLQTVIESITPAAQATIPGYEGGFSLTVTNRPLRVFLGFHWDGIDWTAGAIFLRVAWVAAALALVLLAATFFDRFDPARSRGLPPSKRKAASATLEEGAFSPSSSAEASSAVRIHLTPLAHDLNHSEFGRIFIAELRLAVRGLRWWWYAIAAGLIVAQLFAPLDISRGPLLAAAWIWPILIWSAIGTRETRYGTQQLLFSSARVLRRQLPAAWLVGVALTSLLGAGVALRLVIAGRPASLLAWAAGALFVPSLALASGVWTGTGRFFEALYTALWYVGPLNRVPGLDFAGGENGPFTSRFAWMYLALAAILVAVAFARRAHQLHGT